jgi:hypothetical protein
MSASLQTCEGQQDYVLQRSEKFSPFHLFCNIEQITARGQEAKDKLEKFHGRAGAVLTCRSLRVHRVVAVRISGERRDCGKGWEKLKSEVGIAPHKLLDADRENLRLR